MKTYNTQEELDADLNANGDLVIDDDITINFDCKVGNIKACDIKAWNIKACDIKAWNIDADDIDAVDIKACDIKAWNIKACDIKACDIDAVDINYHAACIAYSSLKCRSIKGRRENSVHMCLDNEIEKKGN